MKYLLLSLFILGCGKIEQAGDYNFLKSVSLTPLTYSPESNEVSDLRDICNVLNHKEQIAPTYVGKTYRYQNFKKDCTQGSSLEGEISTVTVQESSGKYLLKESNGLDYIFRDFELKSTGSLAQVCAQLDSGNVQTPILLNSTTALSFTTRDYQSTDCARTNDTRCIKLTTVLKNSEFETEGKAIAVEWIRFKTNASYPNVGIWDYRKIATPTGCLDGQYEARSASLK